MSNLSDIGFPVRSEQDVNDVIMKVLENVSEIPCPRGSYYNFSDASGAAIYLQANASQELIGFNPHFEGKSRRTVCLTAAIEKESSELDGAFHAWANPSEENNPESGEYPFVFDVPDFRVNTDLNFPQNRQIQLTAFASNEFGIFAGEQDFYDSQKEEIKFAAKSFIPSGLFNLDADSTQPPLAFGVFTGEIREFDLKTNELTGEKFYWFLVDTLGGEIDVVADPKLVTVEPNIGGYLNGQFWLSGRLREVGE
jgi:hypothetical protein